MTIRRWNDRIFIGNLVAEDPLRGAAPDRRFPASAAALPAMVSAHPRIA